MPQAGQLRTAVESPGGAATHPQLDRLLLRIVDGGLAGCIFLVPMLMGGRQALGQLVLVTLAVVVAAAWSVRQLLRTKFLWRRCGALWLLAAGAILLIVQIAPLSPSMLSRVAPHTSEILPLWTAETGDDASMGLWNCISLTPGETEAAAAVFLAYCLLFLVTVQRIRGIEDVERLLRWIAVAVMIMAGFGLIQLLSSNGKFFWFYEHPFTDTFEVAKGSFTNRNHFAHFLALGIGPLIWWLQDNLAGRRQNGHRRSNAIGQEFQTQQRFSGLCCLGIGIVLFAALMSLSRGGTAAILLAAVICVAVCWRARTLGIRVVLALGGAAAMIGVLLTIHGYDRVTTRIDSLSSGSIERMDQDSGRRTIWKTVARAIPDYALLGAGVGSHREVYPLYLEQPLQTEYTHAENGPLQVLLETGVVGLTLVAVGIGLCGFWCIAGLRRSVAKRAQVCIGAVAAGLAVSVAHSMADFVWYVPACMAVVAVLAGCACRLYQLGSVRKDRPQRPVRIPGLVAAAAVVVLAAVGVWMIAGRVGPTLAEPHWDRYRIMAMASSETMADEERAEASPGTDRVDEASAEALARMIGELELVVRHDPNHARAHLRLAAAYLRRFDLRQQVAENVMPLSQIRDAASQGRADADPAIRKQTEQWLVRTIGEQGNSLQQALAYTRRGLALCPLQGEGYLYVAELQFLEGPEAGAGKSAYIDQALKVRPLDGNVLFEAGRQAWLTGDYRQGTEYWKQAFRSKRSYQKQLIEMCVGRVPVDSLLRNYQPDLTAAGFLHDVYRGFGQPESAAELDAAYLEMCRVSRQPPGSPDAARVWWSAEFDKVCHYYARMAEARQQDLSVKTAAEIWMRLRRSYYLMGNLDAAVACARRALKCTPNNDRARETLGTCLAKQGNYAEAEEHLTWCLDRRPNDKTLLQLIDWVAEQRIRGDDVSLRPDGNTTLRR
ncbi:MAG: O-antigen ligase family protein [Candidatus Nealsonbacteria bacterium]|nr:O-antigen ligase family protein [Candidatus Nealsonbacteria bacterium]